MAQRAASVDSKALRRRSRNAKVVSTSPAPRLRVPKPIRRLQRQAPMYAMQGINELSTRLREMTGRDVIDMNRLMEIVQFLYQQRELARRGADYAVDDFGFDAEWTESFLVLFKALYRDYWRGRAARSQNGPAPPPRPLLPNQPRARPTDAPPR